MLGIYSLLLQGQELASHLRERCTQLDKFCAASRCNGVCEVPGGKSLYTRHQIVQRTCHCTSYERKQQRFKQYSQYAYQIDRMVQPCNQRVEGRKRHHHVTVDRRCRRSMQQYGRKCVLIRFESQLTRGHTGRNVS